MKYPDHFQFETDDGVPFKVDYDYDRGEPMTRDHPGSPASIEIIAVDFGKGWEDPDVYPQLNIDQLEFEIGEKLNGIDEFNSLGPEHG